MPTRVHLSPLLLQPGDLDGGLAIVIDLLRASTTIVTALANGAASVIPCEEVEEARAAAASRPGALLGGERASVRIEGFDLGNSPAEYTRERVSGRTIVFTTTNGTRAIRRAVAAGDPATTIALGCFANFSRVIEYALHEPDREVHLVCAGVKGEVCLEDTLCAGALAGALAEHTREPLDHDPASIAAELWARAHADGLEAALRRSRGGRNLIAAGLGADIPLCAVRDLHPVLPVFDPASGAVAPAHG